MWVDPTNIEKMRKCVCVCHYVPYKTDLNKIWHRDTSSLCPKITNYADLSPALFHMGKDRGSTKFAYINASFHYRAGETAGR